MIHGRRSEGEYRSPSWVCAGLGCFGARANAVLCIEGRPGGKVLTKKTTLTYARMPRQKPFTIRLTAAAASECVEV
jgi:hypothetical protein